MIRSVRRPAFSLFELMFLLAVLLLLGGLMIPAVVRIRVAAGRVQSENNLKQLCLAVHNCASSKCNVLPAGVDDQHFSASAKLLPYMDQEQLYNQIDLTKAVDDEANAEARKTQVKTFLDPADPIVSVRDDSGATNYLWNDEVFGLNTKASFPASFPDGTSNTVMVGSTLKGDGGKKAVDVKRQHILLGEKALKGLEDDAGVKDWKADKNVAGDRCAAWIDGRFLQGTFNAGLKLNDERPDVSCGGAGGLSSLRSLEDVVIVGLADCSVRVLSSKGLSHQTWKNAVCPNDGQVLGSDW